MGSLRTDPPTKASTTQNGLSEVVPKLNYLPMRGRGEPIRLTLAALGLPWEEVHWGTWNGASTGLFNIDWQPHIKQDLELFEFFQAPSITIGEHTYSQSNAIIRHYARKYGLYGGSEHEALRVDAIVDGVEALRAKFTALCYVDLMRPDGIEGYWKQVGDPAALGAFNFKSCGAHLGFLSRMLEKCGGAGGFAVGDKLTIADVQLYDIVDNHLILYDEAIRSEYPLLAAHHKLIGGLPAIRAYLASDERYPHVAGSNVIVDDELQPEHVNSKRAAVEEFIRMS